MRRAAEEAVETVGAVEAAVGAAACCGTEIALPLTLTPTLTLTLTLTLTRYGDRVSLTSHAGAYLSASAASGRVAARRKRVGADARI